MGLFHICPVASTGQEGTALTFSGAPLSVDIQHPAIDQKLSGTTETYVVVPVIGVVPVAIRDAQIVLIVVPGAAPLVVHPRERQMTLPGSPV